MRSYLAILYAESDRLNVNLRQAFNRAGVSDSTYYRNINEVTELRHDTALRVWIAIHDIWAIEYGRKIVKAAKHSDGKLNPRTIRRMMNEAKRKVPAHLDPSEVDLSDLQS